MAQYLWNDERHAFFDFNFDTAKGSTYVYASMFYPLWAGLATPEQAKGVVASLKGFEQPGGLPMSTFDSGAQWDLPYGWGNMEMIVTDAVRKSGCNDDGIRISHHFRSTVA